MREWTVAGTTITDASPAYVIAECSHNHQGSVDIAREMFRVAKECGADAVKLQKRSPAFYAALRAKGLGEYAAVREMRELDGSDYWELMHYAHHLGLAFIVTAFDHDSIDFVAQYGPDAIKLASGAVHNPSMVDAAAKTGLPILLSTGCAGLSDIARVIGSLLWARRSVALLQCTSAYPCPDDAMHLRTIETFRGHFPATTVGLSSHHPANTLEPVAYALGARIFEKHFTLSRALGVGDHANSLDPAGLRELVGNLRAVEVALGDGVKRFLPCEDTGRRRLDLNWPPVATPTPAHPMAA